MTVLAFQENAYIAEIEQNVLGALMMGGDGRDTLALLQEHHFVEVFHRHLFRALKVAREQYGMCIPSVVLKLIPQEQIEAFKKNNGIEANAYIARLMANATSGAGQSSENAKKIIEQWARLSLADEAGRLYDVANDPQADVKKLAHEAAQRIDDIMAEVRSGPKKNTRVSVGQASAKAIDAAEAAKKNGTGLTGVTWGLTDLNRMTGGIQRRDLTLIGARPSMGKTTVALSVALSAAKAGHCCGFVSLEMDAEKVAARALSDVMYDWNCRIPYVDLIRGNVNDSQLEQVFEAQARLDAMPLMIDEQSGQTITDIRIRAERLAEDAARKGRPLQVLFIDHLGLIRPSSRYSGNRTNEIAEITSGAKTIARELDVGVVLLSQLNRSLETREEKRPQISDLRDSGAIEQDADMIAFLFREAYYLEREQGGSFEQEAERTERLLEVKNKLEFIIAKQRNGALGTVELFTDIAFSAVRNGARAR